MALRLLTTVRFLNNAYNVRYLHISSPSYKIVQFVLSDIGEGIREVTIRDWFVNVGDKVAQFDNICLVESDKASVNITSRYDGIIKGLHYQVGDVALVGNPLVDIDAFENDNEDITAAPVNSPTSVQQVGVKKTDDYIGNKKLATPAVRRIAMEHNISIKDISGSGKAGRVMKEDILNFINKPNKSDIDTKPLIMNSEEKDKIVPITGIKKVMAKTMTESSKIPTFAYFDDINMTKLVEFRNEIKNSKKSKNITYMPFFIKAMSKCIEVFPEINSLVDSNCENIIVKSYHNIGIAVDTPKGLVVPNIKNVQNLSISQVNDELNLLMEKGRNGTLLPGDMSKGTISISNIGAIGGTYAMPLINPPEVCILAIGKIRKTPLFNENNEIIKSYVCSVSWTADHRIIDGATMARFSNMLKEYIENPHYLLISL